MGSTRFTIDRDNTSVSELRASRQVARMAGRVCVVIGVGPGLGMSCVRQWAKEGYKVAMVSRTASKLEAAAAENPGTLPVAADVTNPASLTAALTTVEQKLGEIHTVVYNAGLGVWATYENVTHEKLEMSMKTNVHGLLTVAQHVGPKMTLVRRESTASTSSSTVASVVRAGTKDRTDREWIRMRSRLTTGTSPTSPRTTGLRSSTVVLGSRTGRVLLLPSETRATQKDGSVLFSHPLIAQY